MSVFNDLIEARDRLARAVDEILTSIEQDRAPARLETELVDCKEEAGRRGHGGILLPGEPHNLGAADALAKEVCCLANTPGGGALIVGVEDGTWQVLGTALDAGWLRHRINQLVGIAPAVEERELAVGRVLVIYVTESPEPITDQDGNIRWRVHDNCDPVDRSEWWQRREARIGLDQMAAATSRLAADVSAGALVAARAYLEEAGERELAAVADEELLRRLGVLRSDGHLTQAGSLLFCKAERPLLTLAVFDVVGGDVINTYLGSANQSLLEQLRELEGRLEAVNTILSIPRGFVEGQVRRLPPRAVREAVINGLVHRDWMDHEPTEVVWVEADSRLQVTSPGGFPGEITENNVLTQRDARYPALSDAFRALLLVDKQGVGVDRMYREMIALGHRPPEIVEIDGPRVRCLLNGGEPVMPVVELISAIHPEVRQRDVRIAIIIFALLHQAFLTREQAAAILQTSEADALTALEAAAETRIGSEPLLRTHQDAWIFGKSARTLLNAALAGKPSRAGGLLTYDHPKNNDDTRAVILEWLAAHDQISAGDYAALAGVAQPSASRTLKGFDGDLLERRGPNRGRNAHFVRRFA